MSSPEAGPPPFVLTLIPAEQEFNNEYELAIVPACKAAGAYIERADGRIAPDDVLQRVQNLIAKADLVIAEMTSRNETIFYETGYAHALGKPVILLTKDAKDIPFDLKHYPHIVYGGLVELKAELERWVRHLLELGARGESPLAVPIDIEIEGVWLNKETPTPIRIGRDNANDRSFWVTMYHEAVRVAARPVVLQVGVIAPERFKPVSDDERDLDSIEIDNGAARLHLSANEFTILPGSWERTIFHVYANHPRTEKSPDSFAIRIFTADGFSDFPFTIDDIP